MPEALAVDLLISARWVIPIRPANTVLEHYSLAITGDRITALLPTAEALQQFQPRQHVELRDHVLMPGLINMHGHAAMTLFRGLADDLPLMTWLQEHIWPAEARWVNDEFAEDGVTLAIAEMLLGGTTCFSDMYFFPDATARIASKYQMRTQICFPVLDFPTNWARDAADYIHKGLKLHDTYRDSQYVFTAFGPHAPYTVSDGPIKEVVTLAAQLDIPVQIHLHETAFEVSEAEKASGKRPIRRLYELGLLTESTQCVHMTQISEEDLALLQETKAHVVHCPESNLKLASGFCPVDKLLKNGVNVCIGTDGAASNNDLDLLGEVRTAALLAKAVSGNAAALNAFEALEMATINGAQAMGLADRLGSLEAGKWADVIAIDLSGLETQPVYHPASQIVYATPAQRVTHSWIGGKLKLDNRRLVNIDIQAVRDKAARWAARIQSPEAQAD